MSKASQRSRKPWDACARRCKGDEHYGNRGHLYRVAASFGEHRLNQCGFMEHPLTGTIKCARCGHVRYARPITYGG